MDRAELIRQIHEGRAAFNAALAMFDEDILSDPILLNGWSVKDVIAHVGFWERRIATLYDILAAGDVPQDTVTSETLDELNARMLEEYQTLPLGIARLNEEEAYQAILSVAENAPEGDLFDEQRFTWSQGTPFHRFIAENTYEHYADHVPDLLSAASRNKVQGS